MIRFTVLQRCPAGERCREGGRVYRGGLFCAAGFDIGGFLRLFPGPRLCFGGPGEETTVSGGKRCFRSRRCTLGFLEGRFGCVSVGPCVGTVTGVRRVPTMIRLFVGDRVEGIRGGSGTHHCASSRGSFFITLRGDDPQKCARVQGFFSLPSPHALGETLRGVSLQSNVGRGLFSCLRRGSRHEDRLSERYALLFSRISLQPGLRCGGNSRVMSKLRAIDNRHDFGVTSRTLMFVLHKLCGT